MKFLRISFALCIAVQATSCYSATSHKSGGPPREIPKHLVDAFTLGGRMHVQYWYFNEAYPATKPLVYTKKEIEECRSRIARKENGNYGKTDAFLYRAFDTFRDLMQGKSVAVLGSRVPWYEAMVMHYGGLPTTIEYNTIISEHDGLRTMTVSEYDANPIQFDVLLSVSSFEHDGLGRYGDPINPVGDFGAMKRSWNMLKDGGILFLTVPIGRDCLTWNAHRIYGKYRIPMLLEGWELLGFFGEHKTYQEAVASHKVPAKPSVSMCYAYEPVFVLRKTVKA